MKALIYKELKLAMHPICYIFIIAFPFMILIPNYPVAIGFIYILSAYPILFLGANKGQQSNDLLFSTLLPIRKKDIVLARIITLVIMHVTFTVITCLLSPLAKFIQSGIPLDPSLEGIVSQGLTADGIVSVVGFALMGLAISDLIYLPIYYKNGKSIVLSTLLSIFFFVTFISVTTIVIPCMPEFIGYYNFLCNEGIWNQLLVFGIGLIIYIVVHILVYKISSKRLEKVDF